MNFTLQLLTYQFHFITSNVGSTELSDTDVGRIVDEMLERERFSDILTGNISMF